MEKTLLGGAVAFGAVFLGVARAPDELIGSSRGMLLIGLSILGLAAVNIGVLRWLRQKRAAVPVQQPAEQSTSASSTGEYESKNWETRHPEGTSDKVKAQAREIEQYLDEVEGSAWVSSDKSKAATGKEAKKLPKINRVEKVVTVNTAEPQGAGFDDRYKAKQSKAQNRSLDQWDKIDYGDEFERVNGDRRAFGEMNSQEKTHMELLKMYQKDPAQVEQLAKQIAPAINSKKKAKAAAEAKTNSHKKPVAKKPASNKQHADELSDMLKQKGFEGAQVYSGQHFGGSAKEEELAPFKDRIEEITE